MPNSSTPSFHRWVGVHAGELFLEAVLAVLSIPFIVVTFGVFYFLINVLMLYLTAWIVPQFTIVSFWWAVLAAIIVSVVNGILHMFFGRPREYAGHTLE